MKYLVALMAIMLVAVLAVTCQTMPVTQGAVPEPTATLYALPMEAPGQPVQITVLGSGFLTSTTVQLKINNSANVWCSVTTNGWGCFMVTEAQPSALASQEVYAIEAYVGNTLWATFPWVAV